MRICANRKCDNKNIIYVKDFDIKNLKNTLRELWSHDEIKLYNMYFDEMDMCEDLLNNNKIIVKDPKCDIDIISDINDIVVRFLYKRHESITKEEVIDELINQQEECILERCDMLSDLLE